MVKVFVCVLGIFIAANSIAQAQSLSSPSTWVNQRTSVLSVMAVDSDGSIHGTFTNNAEGTDCKGMPFDLVGKVKGNIAVFVVTFPKCNTVTVWRGRVAGSMIKTRFAAAYPAASGHLKIWRGKDVFTKQ